MIFAPAPYAAKTSVPKLVINFVNNTNPSALTDISSDEGNPSLNAFWINQKSGLKSDQFSLIPYFPRNRIHNPIPADIPWVIKVAIAAHWGHIWGIGQNSRINIGSIIKLRSAVPAIIYSGLFTSQTPLNIDWNIEKIKVKSRPQNVVCK